MKHATEVIDLLAAYPGREFWMAEILRHVARGRELSPREKAAMRKAVARVLDALADGDLVRRDRYTSTSATYTWIGGTTAGGNHG